MCACVVDDVLLAAWLVLAAVLLHALRSATCSLAPLTSCWACRSAQGIGRQLMRAAMSSAIRQWGAERLYTHVEADNEVSRAAAGGYMRIAGVKGYAASCLLHEARHAG